MVITPEQREENHKAFIKEIHQAFYNYRDNQVQPKFVISLYIKEFIAQGVFKKMPKPTKKTLDKVYRNMLFNLKGNDRRIMIDDYHSGRISSILISEAQAVQNNVVIAKLFDKLIEQKKDIKDVIK